eukprot:14364093-Alexandrium_andersonii.AAC.1
MGLTRTLLQPDAADGRALLLDCPSAHGHLSSHMCPPMACPQTRQRRSWGADWDVLLVPNFPQARSTAPRRCVQPPEPPL